VVPALHCDRGVPTYNIMVDIHLGKLRLKLKPNLSDFDLCVCQLLLLILQPLQLALVASPTLLCHQYPLLPPVIGTGGSQSPASLLRAGTSGAGSPRTSPFALTTPVTKTLASG